MIQQQQQAVRLPDGTEFVDRMDVVQYWRDGDGEWWVYLPGCGSGRCSSHTVTLHDDGTATFEPSILMYGPSDGKPSQAHGYIRRGVWMPC